MSKYNSHNINEKTKNKLNQIKNKLGIPSLSYSKAIDYALIILWGKGHLMKRNGYQAVKEHYQKKIKTLLYELKQSQVLSTTSQTNADLNKYIFELHEAKNQMHKDLQKFCRLYYDTARSYKHY